MTESCNGINTIILYQRIKILSMKLLNKYNSWIRAMVEIKDKNLEFKENTLDIHLYYVLYSGQVLKIEAAKISPWFSHV